MISQLEKPGDVIEGAGALLRHGRLLASVNYHLAVPTQTHFFVNPTGKLKTDYTNHVAGFILLTPPAAAQIKLDAYTLELADKTKLPVRIERRYAETDYQGQPRVSFWVKVEWLG